MKEYGIHDFLPLFFLANFYGLIGCGAILCLEPTQEWSFCVLIPVAIATSTAVAVWSVVGLGSYIARTLSAISFGMIVAFWCAYAAWIVENRHDVTSSMTVVFWNTIAGSFGAMVVLQIPIWAFRLLGRWRCQLPGSTPTSNIGLAEMLIVTFAFCFSFSIPQFLGIFVGEYPIDPWAIVLVLSLSMVIEVFMLPVVYWVWKEDVDLASSFLRLVIYGAVISVVLMAIPFCVNNFQSAGLTINFACVALVMQTLFAFWGILALVSNMDVVIAKQGVARGQGSPYRTQA
jgi:hypothetical protein